MVKVKYENPYKTSFGKAEEEMDEKLSNKDDVRLLSVVSEG